MLTNDEIRDRLAEILDNLSWSEDDDRNAFRSYIIDAQDGIVKLLEDLAEDDPPAFVVYEVEIAGPRGWYYEIPGLIHEDGEPERDGPYQTRDEARLAALEALANG